MALSDEELMLKIKDGDLGAFNILMKRWESDLLKFVNHIIGDFETTKDICQDVFLKVYQTAKHYRHQSLFRNWLYRIAVNCSIDELRKHKRRQEIPLISSSEYRDSANQVKDIDLPDPNPQPDEIVHENDNAKHVQNALERLPYKQRIVIVMKLYDDMKFEEIAAILDCPISTVKSRMYEGLEKMRNMLKHLC